LAKVPDGAERAAAYCKKEKGISMIEQPATNKFIYHLTTNKNKIFYCGSYIFYNLYFIERLWGSDGYLLLNEKC
jgi:hypothetical protein